MGRGAGRFGGGGDQAKACQKAGPAGGLEGGREATGGGGLQRAQRAGRRAGEPRIEKMTTVTRNHHFPSFVHRCFCMFSSFSSCVYHYRLHFLAGLHFPLHFLHFHHFLLIFWPAFIFLVMFSSLFFQFFIISSSFSRQPFLLVFSHFPLHFLAGLHYPLLSSPFSGRLLFYSSFVLHFLMPSFSLHFLLGPSQLVDSRQKRTEQSPCVLRIILDQKGHGPQVHQSLIV